MPPRKTAVPAPPKWIEDDDEDADFIDPAGVIPGRSATPEELEPYMPEDDDVITAMVPSPATHHLVVGMGTLAAMSEEEFAAKLDVMERGQARIRIIQDRLLVQGEDYGRIKGIDRPFLHQPGAEKLANFYGFAVEQIAERLIGTKDDKGEWLSPPLAYHVRSLVHLGDFSGPIIAQGYGESSVWEEKHRWRWEYPKCLKCGHELMKGKPGSKMEGLYYCPGFKGGCWAKFAMSDVQPPTKVENPDPWSLAETLIAMASKRSMVSSIRRATGTSGLFTMDEDSPSVLAQADTSDDDRGEPVVTAAPIGIAVGVGARSEEPTQLQVRRLAEVAKSKGVGGAKMAELMTRLFGIEVEPTGAAASAAVKTLTGDQIGSLLQCLETGEIPNGDSEGVRVQAAEPEV